MFLYIYVAVCKLDNNNNKNIEDDKCRLCHHSSETLDHLLSSCDIIG